MKKIHFIIGILALAVCGCIKEDIVADAPVDEMVKIRLSTAEPPVILGAETRTVLNEDLSVEWNADDKVLMYSKTNYVELANVAGKGPVGIFEGTISKEMLTSAAPEIVVYPGDVKSYSPDLGPDNNGWGLVKLPVRAEQELVSGSFGRGANTSVAVFKLEEGNDPLHFKNICGLLKVSLYGKATVKSLAITSPGYLAGLVNFRVTDNTVGEDLTFQLDNLQSESNTVTLISEKGFDLNGEKHDFYACVLPGETRLHSSTDKLGEGAIAGEYAITVTTVEGKTVEETIIIDYDLSCGELFELGEMEVNYDFTDAEGQTFDLDSKGVEFKRLPYEISDQVPAITEKPDWINAIVADGYITIMPKINLSGSERTGSITIMYGDESAIVHFRQATVTNVLDITSFGCDAGATVSYEIPFEESIASYISDWDIEAESWMTFNKGRTSFTVNVSENTSGKDRVGSVIVRYGDGDAFSTLTVKQSHFTHTDLLGRYSLYFKNNNNKDSGWRLTFSENPEKENSLTVSAITSDGRDVAAYCTDVKIDYVNKGPDGPYLRLTGSNIKAVAEDGSATNGHDFLFPYSWDGDLKFDLAGNYGIAIYNSGAVWEWMTPRTGTDCLSITKWGKNHEGFKTNE